MTACQGGGAAGGKAAATPHALGHRTAVGTGAAGGQCALIPCSVLTKPAPAPCVPALVLQASAEFAADVKKIEEASKACAGRVTRSSLRQ